MLEMSNNELREIIQSQAKRGKWEGVVEIYGQYPEAQKLKLTREGDTALHMAVIDNKEEIVEKLVELICKSHDYKELLEATNERENNALHLAAVLGSVRMCHAITMAHEGLVDKRNIVKETPLFLAAVYGNANAFYCLYYNCRHDPYRILINCRASKGDSVLHYAIRNEHFDLAFQIIHLNQEFGNFVNEQGVNPLHVLASKPTCVKNGANISGWRNILYNCIPVHQLKPEPLESLARGKAWKKLYVRTIENSFLYSTKLQDILYHVVGCIFKRKKCVVANKERDLEKCDSPEIRSLDTEYLHEALESEEDMLSMTNISENYSTCVHFFKIAFSVIMIMLEGGFPEIRKIREKKQKHIWSVQVMDKLIELARYDQQSDRGRSPWVEVSTDIEITLPYEKEYSNVIELKNTLLELHNSYNKSGSNYMSEEVIHLAAKNGVIEILVAMYKRFPREMWHTRESDGKNVVHLAAEHRQSEVYKFLLKKKYHLETLFRAVDKNGNSALHLAAAKSAPKLWHINGPALQMQWEVEWYKLVKQSMPLHFFALYNNKSETASTIFEENHMDLVQKVKDWLYSASQSCTLVATLIATVAFATAAIIPGSNGNDNDNNLVEKEKVSFIFAISSLVALSLSTTSVIMFLAILTARFDIGDYFGSMFPWRLLIGLSSLYSSIVAMLISFCTGSSYFIINHHLPNKVILLYTLIFFPVPFILAIVHLPLYYDLLLVLLKIVPKRKVHVDLCD